MASNVAVLAKADLLSPMIVLRRECLRRGPLLAGFGIGGGLGLLVCLAVTLALIPPEPPPPAEPPPLVRQAHAPSTANPVTPTPSLARMDVVELSAILRQGTPPIRRAIVAEIERRGPAARSTLPILIGVLGGPDEVLSGAAERALRATEPPLPSELDVLRAGLSDRSPEVRRYCLHALATLKKDARPAAADLVAVLKSDDGQDQADARDVLVALGPEVRDQLPALLVLLADRRPDVQARALEVLDAVKPLGPTEVPLLAKTLESPNTMVRQYAVAALGAIGRPARPALAAMLDQLADRDDEVAKVAADALARLGPWTTDDLPALRQAAGHANPRVKTFAARAVLPLGRAARPAVPELTRLVEDRDAEVRLTALRALTAIGPEAHSALLAVVKLLDSAEGEALTPATTCLAALGDPTTEDLPLLRPLLEETRPLLVRATAAALLGRVRDEDTAVITSLLLLYEPDAAVRLVALKSAQAQPPEVLARLAPRLKGQVPRLKSGLEAEDPAVRLLTLKLLGHLGEDGSEAAPAVLALYESQAGPTRKPALETLALIGPSHPPTHKALIERLGRGGESQALAIEALAALGKPAAPALARALSDRNEAIRLGSAKALEKIGPPARADALGALTDRLRVQDRPEIREAVRLAFVRLQQKQ